MGWRRAVPTIGAWAMLVTRLARADGPATQPATRPGVQPTPADEPAFDPTLYACGDPLGARSALARRGVTVSPSLILDESQVLKGGLDTAHDAPRGRLSLDVQGDTRKLFGLHGGLVDALFQDQFGVNPSARSVGDVQNFSFGTDPGTPAQLTQLYYQQALGPGDLLRFKGGKVDANADFDVLDSAQDFLNSSWGANPTIGPMPSYPDTATGLELFAQPADAFYAGGGVFDGSLARGRHTGAYGPSKFLNRGDNLFLIAEVGSRYDLNLLPLARLFPGLAGAKLDGAKLDGHVGVGGWYSTDPFGTFAGGTTHGTGGTYVTLDQVLYRPAKGPSEPAGVPGQYPTGVAPAEQDPRSIALDFSYAHAESDVNLIDDSVIGGFTWVGALPVHSRRRDVAGVGVLVAGFGPQVNRREHAETSLEAFYRLRITPWASVKPDVQYIFHPNGSGPTTGRLVRDALVFDVRVELAF